MPNLPNKLQHGDNWKSASVNAINQIIDYLKSQRIVVDNKTISATQGVNGITLTAKPQTSAKPGGSKTVNSTVTIDEGAAVPAVLGNTASRFLQQYTVTLYPNGFGGSETQSAYYVLPTALSYSIDPPDGARIIVFKAYVDSLGGDDQANGVTN